MRALTGTYGRVGLALICVCLAAPTRAATTVRPSADGTLADGGGFGVLDGRADSSNWTFGSTGFAGAVTLTTETASSAVEHRMVFEYDLRGLDLVTPLVATLSFTTRGVPVSPFPDVLVNVYSYPADLIESLDDFSARPAILQGAFSVAAAEAPKIQILDVTELVTSALQSGNKRVGLRFQIDPNTTHVTNQAFINALDSQPDTKPVLTIRSAVRGDADDDGDADLDDFAIFTDCLTGPDMTPMPTRSGMTAVGCLAVFDQDTDGDVDLDDLSGMLRAFKTE